MERSLNILLVDDDSVDVMNVQRALKKNNSPSRVWVATNGIEALDMLRSNVIPEERRLILLDLNMPRMNGIEFLRALRLDPTLASSSVVVLTTSREESDRDAVYELHAAGYLLKPVDFDECVEMIGALCQYWSRVEMGG